MEQALKGRIDALMGSYCIDTTEVTVSQFNALGKMALFPLFTLACYLGLIMYFRSRGGYKPVHLDSRT